MAVCDLRRDGPIAIPALHASKSRSLWVSGKMHLGSSNPRGPVSFSQCTLFQGKISGHLALTDVRSYRCTSRGRKPRMSVHLEFGRCENSILNSTMIFVEGDTVFQDACFINIIRLVLEGVQSRRIKYLMF